MKNIVYKVTWKNMKMNKRRTWTAFFGIFFMVLLITCVFVGRKTAVSYLQEVASLAKGKWHFTIEDAGKKELDAVEGLSCIEQTARSFDKGYTEFQASANALRPYLFIKSYEEPCYEWMNLHVKEGRLPEKKGEVVISESAAEDGAKIRPGDTIKAAYFKRTITGIEEGTDTMFPFQSLTVKYGETKELSQDFPYYKENKSFRIDQEFTGEEEELTVVGIINTPWFEQEGAAGYLAFTCCDGDAADAFNIVGTLNLKEKMEGLGFYEELMEIAGDKKISFNDYVLSFSGESSDSVVNFIVKIMTVFFMVLIAAAAVILIYNVFNISFDERSRYLGMLCSVGATGKQKRSSVYFEAFALFLPALPLGILAGCGAVLLGMHLLLPFIYKMMSIWAALPEEIPVRLGVSAGDILLIIAGSGLTVLLSSVLPAMKISKVGPIECIRGNIEKTRSGRRKELKGSLQMDAEKMLAKNSLRFQRRKTRGMSRAAAIFMVILIVTTSLAQLLTKLITYRMADTETITTQVDGWDYSLTVFNENTAGYDEIKKEILEDEGVEEIREEYTGMFLGEVPKETLSQEYWDALHRVFNLYYHRELSDEEFMGHFGEDSAQTINLVGVDDRTLGQIADATDTDKELLKGEKPAAIVIQSGEVSTESWSVSGRVPEKFEFYEIEHMTELKKGETIPMELYSEKEEKKVDFPLCVAGFGTNEQLKDFFTFHSEMLWVIVDQDTCARINETVAAPADAGEEIESNEMNPTLYMRMNGKETGLIKKLTALAEADDAHYAFGETGITQTLANTLCSIIRIMLLCFVLLTSVICLLNLYNSVHGWIAEQKPQFAMLVSVGAAQSQIKKMLVLEVLHIFFRSCIWASLISAPLILGCRKLLTERFGQVRFAFPWWVYAAAFFITAIVILGFMLYHYHREKDYQLRTVLMV